MNRSIYIPLLVSAVSLYGRAAHAQQTSSDPFFADKVTEEDARGEKPSGTSIQGSVTASTFFYQESGDTSEELAVADTVSPASRLYGDLRLQLDAKNLAGGSWNARTDFRGRYSADCTFDSDPMLHPTAEQDCKVQSGTFGGNELDLRELNVRKAGALEFVIGRQFATELALTKVDGVRVNKQLNETWTVMGFAGLHPARTSRSVTEDYPAQVDAAGAEGGPIFPVTAGAGSSYRYATVYGSVGAVGIMPLNEQKRGIDETGLENPRIYVTSNGYWRPSPMLNVYHYLVADGLGADGPALTNLSLGANIRLTPALRLITSVNRVDPETLNVIAQNRVEDPSAANGCQNNAEVARIAFNEGRVALSAALSQQRFEVTVSGRLFQRDGISLDCGDMVVDLEAARGTEVMLSLVDRRSILGTRLGARVMGILPLAGENNQHRSTVYAAALNGSRELASGRAELDMSLWFTSSSDENVKNCAMITPLGCYGTSSVQTVSVDGTFFYRVINDLFAMASVNVANQVLTTNAGQMGEVVAPASFLLTGFLRAAYRF